MTLTELATILLESQSKPTGTYVGVHFDEDTKDIISKLVKEYDVPNPLPAEKYHTTLIYSKKYCPDYKAPGELKTPMTATVKDLEIWKTEGDDPVNMLIIVLDSDDLCKRHEHLMDEHDATYDFPEYKPHLTLSYDVGDFDIAKLKDAVMKLKSFTIVEEYGEELKKNWSDT